MNILQNHNKEVQENLIQFWEEYKDKVGLGQFSDEVTHFITHQNKELLKKITDGEIAILKEKLDFQKKVLQSSYESGYEHALEDQLTHWQQVLQELDT